MDTKNPANLPMGPLWMPIKSSPKVKEAPTCIHNVNLQVIIVNTPAGTLQEHLNLTPRSFTILTLIRKSQLFLDPQLNVAVLGLDQLELLRMSPREGLRAGEPVRRTEE